MIFVSAHIAVTNPRRQVDKSRTTARARIVIEVVIRKVIQNVAIDRQSTSRTATMSEAASNKRFPLVALHFVFVPFSSFVTFPASADSIFSCARNPPSPSPSSTSFFLMVSSAARFSGVSSMTAIVVGGSNRVV